MTDRINQASTVFEHGLRFAAIGAVAAGLFALTSPAFAMAGNPLQNERWATTPIATAPASASRVAKAGVEHSRAPVFAGYAGIYHASIDDIAERSRTLVDAR